MGACRALTGERRVRETGLGRGEGGSVPSPWSFRQKEGVFRCRASMSTSHSSPDPGSRSQPRAFSASCDSMDSIEPGSSERQSSWPEVTQQSCQYFFSLPPTSLPRDSGRPKSKWERSHLPVPCGGGRRRGAPDFRTLGGTKVPGRILWL